MPLISSGVVKGRRCPICGAEHASCGLPYQGDAVAIPKEPTVADAHDLYVYEDANGNTYQMTEADAREAGPGYTRKGGQTTAQAEREREDAGGAEASSPEQPIQDAEPEEKAQAPAANKARTAAENK